MIPSLFNRIAFKFSQWCLQRVIRKQNCGWVTVHDYSRGNYELLYDGEPDPRNLTTLMTLITNLNNGVNPNSILLFHYSTLGDNDELGGWFVVIYYNHKKNKAIPKFVYWLDSILSVEEAFNEVKSTIEGVLCENST